MAVVGRENGMHKVAGQFAALRGALGGVGGMVAALAPGLGALGAGVGLGGLASIVQGAAEAGDALGEMSDRLGIGVEALQGYQYAAMRSGVSNEELEVGFKELNKRIGEAVNGGDEVAATFAKLRINLKTSKGELKSTDQVMLDVADALKAIPNAAERAAVAAALFGKQGYMLAPMLAKGRDGIGELVGQALKFGIISEAQAKASGDYMDSVDNLGKAFRGLRDAIGVGLIPLFQPLISGMENWIVANREIIASGLGEFAAFAGDMVGGLASAIGWVVDGLGGWGNVLLGLAVPFAYVANAMFPVIAIGLALGGLAFVIWKYWEPIKTFFSDLWAGVTVAWQAFFDFALDHFTLLLTPVRVLIAALQTLGKFAIGKGLDTGPIAEALGKTKDSAGRMADRGKAVWDAVPKEFVRPDFGILPKSDGAGTPANSNEALPEMAALAPPPARPENWFGPGGTARMAAAPAVAMATPMPMTRQEAEVRVRLEAAPGTNAQLVGQTQTGGPGLKVATTLDTGQGKVASY
ncbi:MAG: hypothetical protein HQL42_13080 [Alphaproteobacteria bacterium]|nr:hypothetical protein [Alphaproteobacteria bacterium]